MIKIAETAHWCPTMHICRHKLTDKAVINIKINGQCCQDMMTHDQQVTGPDHQIILNNKHEDAWDRFHPKTAEPQTITYSQTSNIVKPFILIILTWSIRDGN